MCSSDLIAAFGDPAAPVDLARGKAARRQPEIGADAARSPEPGRIIDCRIERQGGDRSDPRHGHGASAVDVVPGQAQELASETGDLSPDLLADLEQGSNGRPQKTMLAKQLPGPAAEDVATRRRKTVPPALPMTRPRFFEPSRGSGSRDRARS